MKIVAKALLVDKEGDLLLLNRGATHPHFPGHLDLPGGEVEEGEKWSRAVVREIAEEAGIKVKIEQLNKIFEIYYPHVVHVLYIIKIDTKKPRVILSWEHSNYQWLKLQNLLSLPLPVNSDKYYADVIAYIADHPDAATPIL